MHPIQILNDFKGLILILVRACGLTVEFPAGSRKVRVRFPAGPLFMAMFWNSEIKRSEKDKTL